MGNQVCLVHHQKPKKNGVNSPNFKTNKSTMRLQFSFCWLVILSTFSAIWLFASKVSGASLFDLGCGRCTCSDGSLCSSTGNFMYASRCACTDNGCPSGSEYKDGGVCALASIGLPKVLERFIIPNGDDYAESDLLHSTFLGDLFG